MSLTLKTVLFNGQPYSSGEDVVFNEDGGTIGRSDASTLTLFDKNKMISRRHAEIIFENGKYSLMDCSLAGTFIDGAKEPVKNGLTVELVDGMSIRIGDYIIECQLLASEVPSLNTEQDDLEINQAYKGNPFAEDIIAPPAESNELLDSVANDFQSPLLIDADVGKAGDMLDSENIELESNLLNPSENNSLLDQGSSNFQDIALDKDNSLLASNINVSKPIEQGLRSENISSLNDCFIPADPVKDSLMGENDEMPADFNFEDLFNLDESSSESLSEIDGLINPIQDNIEAPCPPISQAVPVISEKQIQQLNKPQLLHAFLQGAKIDPKEVDCNTPEELITRIGAMFRQFVQSTVTVLRSRAEFKSLFRVSVTTIKMDDNNPLKFAVTTDEAIKQLIKDGQGGFKKSVESIDEGFDDLLKHQLAMQAGIQASLADALKRFDPGLIEQQYSEGIFLQKKAKCWDQYLNVYAKLSESVIEDFYGDAFAEAYEQQMKRLKNKV